MLDGTPGWEQRIPDEENPYDMLRRDIIYIVSGYLVNQSDLEPLLVWACKRDFMTYPIPALQESHGYTFFGELYWSRSPQSGAGL
jgi:hypothetical protein